MGSYSQSSTVTQDNRLAVTESGVGVSNVGGTTNAAFAPLSNLNLATGATLQVTDGGLGGAAFDFAKSAMSQAISAVIDQGKLSNAQANQIQDNAYAALQDAANKTSDANTDNVMKIGKWLLIAAAAVGVAWYWKKGGRK